MMRRFEVRLALGLFLAFGLSGCEVEPMHPRHAGPDAGKGDGQAPVSDSAIMNPDISARSPDGAGASTETKPPENPDVPADLPAVIPDSSPDFAEKPRLDTAPDRNVDTSADTTRDADRSLDLPNEAGRVFSDTNPDRAPDVLAVDSRIPGLDLAPDAPASDAQPTDGQPGLSVLAGMMSGPGGLDGIGPEAQFYYPGAVALDGTGNLYVADSANNTIRKIVLATRQVSTVAGRLGETGSADGLGASARFYSPQGLAADQAGSLYIADSGNHTIRKLDLASGQVTTFAGSAGKEGHVNGRGTAARFQAPTGLALDGAGNLFVTALDNTIRQIVLATGEVTTVAGQTGVAGSDDGTGTAATFTQPRGIAADGAGNLYVGDTENALIRKIVLATGAVTTVAGRAGDNGTVEGIGSAARFSFPTGLALDGAGNLYVADEMLIRKVVLATAAVSNFPWPPSDVRVNSLVYDGAGNFYATEMAEHTVIQVSLASKAMTTVAGQRSTEGNKDGVGAEARFQGPQGLASDNQGGLFVVNGYGNTIRKIDIASGRVTTLAGSNENYGSTDGVGAAALFYGPEGVAYDGEGNLYIADTNNGLIRKLALATGMVTTIAGTAHSQKLADGKGSKALFFGPSGLALDGAGNLYVTDKHAIRKIVLADATVTTLAGPLSGYGSDDGVGAEARFDSPTGLVWDGAGSLFVADTANCTIRQIVVATGTTTTLAGSPGRCESGDGQASSARFKEPVALAMDFAGRLLVADGYDNTVRRIDLATKQVTTIIGHSGRMQTIPGPLPAYVANPAGLAVLSSGDIAISDLSNNVILLARF